MSESRATAPRRQKQPRDEWTKIARRIYRLKGFPTSEMRRYFNAGLGPLAAVEAAYKRRRFKE